MQENRREYFRHKLPEPLKSKIKIAKIGDNNIESTKFADIMIHDIGGLGLGFNTNLDLPVSENVLLNFTFQLLDKEINLHGTIVWKAKKNEERSFGDLDFSYGVQFIFMNEKEKEDLRIAINSYIIFTKKRKR